MSDEPKNSELHSGLQTAINTSRRPERSKILLILWLFSPLVSFMFIRPQWEARLVAVSGSLLFGNLALFYYGFKPGFNFAKGNSLPVGRELWQRCAPIVEDCSVCLVYGESRLLRVEGKITDNDFNFGIFF